MSNSEPFEDLEDLYETAPCGYVSVLPNGRIVKVNGTLADWVGWHSRELVGKPLYDILGFGGRIAFETHLAPLLRMQGHVNEIALDLLRADGEKIPTIANAAEKRSAEGGHLFTRLTLFKAVDRRKFERSLIEARANAEAEAKAQREASLLREQFIAVLGHDLRNPLAAVAAGLRMLGKREQISPRGNEILAEMDRSVDRASSLINDLLDLARGSLGGGFIVHRDGNEALAPVLEQVVAEIRSIAPDKQIDASIDIDDPIYCDRGRIAQLASNLLANAVTHGAADRPIGFEASTTDEQFVLVVSNAGEPIPDAARKHLFQPFFRGEARASRNGLGLGLFIASEVAKAHNGTLEVSSTAEETRFTFVMPKRVPAPA